MSTIIASPYVKQILQATELDRRDEFQWWTTRDLRGHAETLQWLACDLDQEGVSRKVVELQLEPIIEELERRKAVWSRASDDPLRPHWPKQDPDFRSRITRAKRAMRIERFCRDVLGVELSKSGSRLVGPCPFPDHDSVSGRSFHVSADKQLFHCKGCQRGGDVLTLCREYFAGSTFVEALKTVERHAGIQREDA